MNVAIYCGSSLGNNKIYEESTKLLAQKLVQKDFKIETIIFLIGLHLLCRYYLYKIIIICAFE